MTDAERDAYNVTIIQVYPFLPCPICKVSKAVRIRCPNGGKRPDTAH